jgi:hypothetical protein
MKPVDDELIAHIKDSLSAHEEAYVPGAWESFNKGQQKPKVGIIWWYRLGAAAAILLVGFAVFFMVNPSGVKVIPETAGIKADTSKPVISNPVPVGGGEPVNDALASGYKNDVQGQKMPEAGAAFAGPDSSNQVKVSNAVPEVLQPTDKVAQVVQPEKVTDQPKESLASNVSPTANQKQSFQDFLNAETEKNKHQASKRMAANKAENKWDLGLMVAPSIGNDKKLNMGYGVSMEYAVSRKVSISSGISYNQMGASKVIGGGGGNSNPMDAPAGAMALVRETKRLKSVDANLVGLDIPLELKYHISDRFYTNVGVSAFAILNQKQNNNYVEGRLEDESLNAASPSAFKSVFKESTVSEAVPSEEIKNDKYLGFYNLSIGYKQKVSGKNSLSIEPFMKLPIKEYSTENLKLIGTGIRLKFDF